MDSPEPKNVYCQSRSTPTNSALICHSRFAFCCLLAPGEDASMSLMGKLTPGETVTVEERFDFVEATLQGYTEVHDDCGLEFVSCMFPAFDDRYNENALRK